MHLTELLTGIIPISSALLSVLSAIATSFLTKQIKKRTSSTDEVIIKFNNITVKVCNKKELINLIEKNIEKEALQSKNSDKKEALVDSKSGE